MTSRFLFLALLLPVGTEVHAQRAAPVRIDASAGLSPIVPGLQSPILSLGSLSQTSLLTPALNQPSALPSLSLHGLVPALARPLPSAGGTLLRPWAAAVSPAAAVPAVVPAAAQSVLSRTLSGIFTGLSKTERGGAGAGSILGQTFDGSLPGKGAVSAAADTPIRFNGRTLPRRMFTDRDAMGDKLVEAIDATQGNLDIVILELKFRKFADALIRAKARGVKIRVILDERRMYPTPGKGTRSQDIQAIIDAGLEIRTIRGKLPYGMMHNKVSIHDDKLMLAGSFNWTHAADTWNYENAVFLDDAHTIRGFQDYYKWIWDQSRAFDPQQSGPNEDGPYNGLPPKDTVLPVRFHGMKLPAYAFSPSDEPQNWIIKVLEKAGKSLDLAMFSFTSVEIQQAIAAARARGVRVRIVFDKRNALEMREQRWFIENGFDVVVSMGRNKERGVLHNKFAVIDGELVQTGSYNWTQNARHNNFENIVFLDDAVSAEQYTAYFERLRAQGKLADPSMLPPLPPQP